MLSDKSKDAVKRYLKDEYDIEAVDILRVYEDEWDYGICDTCSCPEVGICIEYTEYEEWTHPNRVKKEMIEMTRELREPDFNVPKFLREYVTENDG